VRRAPEFRILRQSNSLSPLQQGVRRAVDLVERRGCGVEQQSIERQVAVAADGVTRVLWRGDDVVDIQFGVFGFEAVVVSQEPAADSATLAPSIAKFTDPDVALRERLRRYAKNHPRRGFRPAYHDARAKGWIVNHNEAQRLWREEGLRVTVT
jgi:hypothetical protein